MKKKLEPVKINDDVWFYVNPKSFEFVVWVGKNGDRRVKEFKVPLSKLKKFLTNE